MGGIASGAVLEREETFGDTCGFSESRVEQWRADVARKRVELFRRNWKNGRPVLRLQSRDEAAAFQFILEWCDESTDVVTREQERNRLDKLIALGVDVNLPREMQPRV